jgi:hypothetical protein
MKDGLGVKSASAVRTDFDAALIWFRCSNTTASSAPLQIAQAALSRAFTNLRLCLHTEAQAGLRRRPSTHLGLRELIRRLHMRPTRTQPTQGEQTR